MRIHLAAIAVATLSAASPGPVHAASESAAVELAPHRAVYTMSLGSVRSGGDIAAVKGAMVMEWSKSCAGWTVKQRYRLQILDNEGASIDTDSNFSSFESLDGLRYQFTTRNTRDGRVTENLRGEARLEAPGGPGEAVFTEPEGTRFELPKGTIFPTEHVIHLVREARNGARRVYRVVFDGATLDGPFEVNAIVGRPLPNPPAKWAAEPLTNRPSWHMRLAFFPLKDTGAEPDYELGLRLFENGVADDFVLDYGSFTVKAKMEKLEALPRPGC